MYVMQPLFFFFHPETLKKTLQGRLFFLKKRSELIPRASLLLLRLAGTGNAMTTAILVQEAPACQGKASFLLLRDSRA